MSLDPLVNICRLCGSKAKLLIGVFTPEGEKLTLERKIRMCLPITVSSEDNLPKQVCHPCLQKLEISYELYLKCNAAQNIIKNLLKFQAVNNTPKTCFIEQVEREKVSENGAKDVRSVEIHMPPPTLAIHTQGQPTYMMPPNLAVHTQGQPMHRPPSTIGMHTQGQPFRNQNGFIETGPIFNRFPLQNGYSMSTNMADVPQSSISNTSVPPPQNLGEQVGLQSAPSARLVSDFSSVGQIRSLNPAEHARRISLSGLLQSQNPNQPVESIALSDLSPVGLIRPAQSFQALSNLQSVGQVRPVSQVRPISQVNVLESTPPPTPNSNLPPPLNSNAPPVPNSNLPPSPYPNPPAEPVDSKENIVLSKGRKSTKNGAAERPAKSKSSKAAKTTVKPASRKLVEKNKVLDSNDAIVPEPMVAMCHTEALDPNLAESATDIAVLLDNNSTDDLDPLGDDSYDVTDIIESTEAPATKRPRNNPDVEVACKYCGKMFTENVIMLHQDLHLRKTFFTCVSCDKNFTTEICLDKHKCVS